MSDPELVIQESAAARALPAAASGRHADAVPVMVLGYLTRGWLSRPEGGTARFRDALVAGFERSGGSVLLNTTVEEIVVSDGRARGRRAHGHHVGPSVVELVCAALRRPFAAPAARCEQAAVVRLS